MHLNRQIIRGTIVLFVVALILCGVGQSPVDAAERLLVGKRFEGGVECNAQPNTIIAQWKLTIDTMTTEQTLYYRGRRNGSKICIESRVVERNSRTKVEEQIARDSTMYNLDCEGDMIFKIQKLTFAMRVSNETLKFTVLSDWDTMYIDPDTALQRCRNGHEWISRSLRGCPLCGTTLSRAD